jgi:hypothetical protein
MIKIFQCRLLEGTGCFSHDKMIAPVFLTSKWLLRRDSQKRLLAAGTEEVERNRQQRVGRLPLPGLPGDNPASCREKNTPSPQLL